MARATCFAAVLCVLGYRSLLAMQPAPPLLVVCAGTDRVLRAPLPGGACAPGERTVSAVSAPSPPAPPEQPGTGDRALSALEARVAQLERELQKVPPNGSRVRAPFEVLDENGKVMFMVGRVASTPGAYVLNAAGKQVAMMMSSSLGGGIVRAVTDGDSGTFTSIVGAPAGLGLLVRDREKIRLTAGRFDVPRFSVQVKNLPGNPIAAIGESVGGQGLVTVLDQTGMPKVSMELGDAAKGLFLVRNSAGNIVATLGESALRGGLLEVGDASGNRVFNAVLSEQGGEACVKRLGSTYCLGIGLLLR